MRLILLLYLFYLCYHPINCDYQQLFEIVEREHPKKAFLLTDFRHLQYLNPVKVITRKSNYRRVGGYGYTLFPPVESRRVGVPDSPYFPLEKNMEARSRVKKVMADNALRYKRSADPNPQPDPVPNPEPNPRPNPDPKPAANPEPMPAANPEPNPAPNPEPRPSPNPEPKPAANPEPNPRPEPRPAPNPEPRPAPNSEPKPAPNPPSQSPATEVTTVKQANLNQTDHRKQETPIKQDVKAAKKKPKTPAAKLRSKPKPKGKAKSPARSKPKAKAKGKGKAKSKAKSKAVVRSQKNQKTKKSNKKAKKGARQNSKRNNKNAKPPPKRSQARNGKGTKKPKRDTDFSGSARRIIAGRDTDISKFPYVISIQKDGQHWCAGALLNRQMFISTANCFWKSVHTTRMRARVGSSYTDRGGVVTGILEIIKHPSWSIRDTPDNDVALGLLDTKLRFSHSLHAVDLPNHAMKPPFDDAWVASWGAIRQDGWFEPGKGQILQVYSSSLMDVVRCTIILGRYGMLLSNNFFCLEQVGRTAPCTADTGAPAVSDGVLWGLASWGIRKRCGTDRYPAMFSYIASPSNLFFITNASRILMSEERVYPYLDKFRDDVPSFQELQRIQRLKSKNTTSNATETAPTVIVTSTEQTPLFLKKK